MSDKRLHIVLIGFMGSGKSTIGKLLAQRLNRPYIDMDERLVRQEEMSIAELFEQKGETYFRKAENRMLKSLLASKTIAVISTGGGAPCFLDGMQSINKSSYSFYLKVGRSILLQRIYQDQERPLVKNKTKTDLKKFIDHTLKKREPFYKQANQTILAFNPPQKIVDRLLKYIDTKKI